MTLKKIGPYELEGILGRGGMGTVYRGLHSDTGQQHAVKVLAPRFAEDQHFRSRFESEIKALLELDHENIVSLFSYGQDDRQLFFAMELVNGQSLFQMQKAGHRFDWRQVLSIARDCANGLRHAHDRGIIHRDLKPGNLMMTTAVDGSPQQVKLTDFGIAKRFGNSQNTGTNILGTMDFMSPEQAKGAPVTARSDLYSLGAVLFTLLAGRPPFSGNSVEESLRNLTSVPPPRISGMDPAIPKSIDGLVSKLMAKKAEERVPTALALLHKITDIENELRDGASAKTSHGETDSRKTKIVPHTPSRGLATKVEDDAPSAADKISGNDSETKAVTYGPTSEQRDLGLAPVDTDQPAETKDFYNQVTESLRRQHSEVDPPQENRSKGVVPLVLALVGVIALGVYGWIRAAAPPTPEQLFAKIELSSDQPEKVIDEIGLFLKHYPNDPRAGSLTELQSTGVAIKEYQTLKNTLTVRARSPKGLTAVEQKFLELAKLAKDDARLAGEKMMAFALVNESVALDEQDLRCVRAAKGFGLKLNHDLRTTAQSELGRILNAFAKTDKMEDSVEALKVCQSLIELYADTDFSSLENPKQGAEALGLVREKIVELEEEIRRERIEAQRKKREGEAKVADQNAEASVVETPGNVEPTEVQP